MILVEVASLVIASSNEEIKMQQSLLTHFDDQSTGKVEQCNHPAPVELPIWEDLNGNFHKHLFGGTEWRVVYQPGENI